MKPERPPSLPRRKPAHDKPQHYCGYGIYERNGMWYVRQLHSANRRAIFCGYSHAECVSHIARLVNAPPKM